jgi:hypothetical protein
VDAECNKDEKMEQSMVVVVAEKLMVVAVKKPVTSVEKHVGQEVHMVVVGVLWRQDYLEKSGKKSARRKRST